jgi:hypothetical protein
MSSQARLTVLLLSSAICSALQAATPVRATTHARPAGVAGQAERHAVPRAWISIMTREGSLTSIARLPSPDV